MIEKMGVKRHIWILIGLSYVFFIFGNGIVNLTSPDEVFYAQTAKEMIHHKTWMVPYLFDAPNFEKPIFTYWFLRIGFILFGVTNFGARFFCGFFAAIGVIAVYLLALLGFKDREKAFTTALILMSSALYVGLARTVFTDMIFTVLILLAFLSFFYAYLKAKHKALGIILFFFFCALATLTKGPLGLLLPLISVFIFLGIRKELKFIFCLESLWGLLFFCLTAIPWYWFIYKEFGQSFIQEFFINDHWRRLLEAEHLGNDKWYFYPLSMIACMFPWSIFVFLSFFYFAKKLKAKNAPAIYLYLLCWIGVIFVVFQVSHSKLVSYIFPLFPAMALVAGDYMSSKKNAERKTFFAASLASWFFLVCFPIALIVSALKYPAHAPSKPILYGFIIFYLIQLMFLLFFIIKKRFLAQIYMLIFQIPLLFYFFLIAHGQASAYISGKEACGYLMRNYAVHNTVLCSKPFMRGVRFYTDMPVAAMNIRGDNYFSPHPTPFLNSYEKVLNFLNNQPLTYAVVRKSDYQDLERMTAGAAMRCELLKIIGDEYIVRINAVEEPKR